MSSDTALQFQHERVDDIPVLLGLMQQLHLPELLEEALGSHHLHRGLSNGWLATIWMAFILSEANHCKVRVQDWACRHQHTLATIAGQSLRDIEFSDDRLAIILRRLHDADWTALEASLWQATCQVYEIPLECIRLDSSTTYGFHELAAQGILQLGHSKDHRPDLPQLKLMAAAAQPTSQVIACDIVPGNCADDPLYLPLIHRLRSQLKRTGLLYAGDCKMAALETRADLADAGDYYLMPLPKTGDTAASFDSWINRGLEQDDVKLEAFTKLDDKNKPFLYARGYEFERDCTCQLNAKTVCWKERVQVLCSESLHQQQASSLDERLQRATEELLALTPPVGRGHKQIRAEADLQAAIAAVLEQRRVTGLLEVTWRRDECVKERQQGRGRPGPGRVTELVTTVRYEVTGVTQRTPAIQAAKERLGWRVQVSNLPKKRCTLEGALLLYNGGWSVERDFHLLKDRPLGIQPLWVREEEQIIGLTRLLTIALRVLTVLELVVRAGLQEAGEKLSGLYEGQARRTTATPTAVRLLKAIGRMQITVTQVKSTESKSWYITPLPPRLQRILELLKLPAKVYTQLAEDTC
jgi:transposase